MLTMLAMLTAELMARQAGPEQDCWANTENGLKQRTCERRLEEKTLSGTLRG